MNIELLSIVAFVAALLLFGVLFYLKKKEVDFGIRTILALFFGGIIGFAFKDHVSYVTAVGRIYTNLISVVVIPLLFFSIISSISSLESIKRLKTIGVKSVGWLTANTFTASVITIILALALKVGKYGNFAMPSDYEAKEVPSFLDTIVSLFPKNVVSHAANGEVVPFIVFAIIIGIALITLNSSNAEKAKPFKDFIDSGNKVIFVVIGYIIELTPYAVLALIANAVSRSGLQDLLPLLRVLVVAYIACAIQLLVVESAFIKFFARLNPIKFFQGIWPAFVVAFTSQSSVGTIPVTIKQLKEKLGVNEEIATFVSGLGANVGMPGCAGVWPTLLAVFAINAFDIPFSAGQYVLLVILAVVVSVGTVGVPGTATITATAVFVAAGLPVDVIVILTPISSIVDMMRTGTNVVGAATAAVLVAKSENEIDLEVYNQVGNIENTQIAK